MKEMLVKFLEKAGENSEFNLFHRIYKDLPAGKFAVVKVSGETLEKHLDEIAEDLAFLNKLGICPIVVHGAGSTLDKMLLNSKKVEGVRITTNSEMQVVKSVFNKLSAELVGKIVEKGGKAESIEGVFECEALKGFGCVGKIKNLNLHGIENAIKNGIMPVLNPIGKYGGSEFNINADTAAKELVKAMQPKKFILLTETGGILDKNNKVLPFINLSSKEKFDFVSGGMLQKVKEIKDFLDTGLDCAVVITSAENLLKEIFTVKGSGTLVKSHAILSSQGFNDLNKSKLKALLENAFGKKLAENYFEEEAKGVLCQKDYEGVAIIKEVNGLPYLDKFGVAKHCQGTGLGKSLWEELDKKYNKLVWRAFACNGANSFYDKQCDGFVKKGNWKVYWKGLCEKEIIPSVEAVAEKQATMIEEAN